MTLTKTTVKSSIILPTYNRKEKISKAIDSVMNQTYSDWELIIWDDGSTDDTYAVVKTYTDNRIRYFKDENHGPAYARNRASEYAQGDFIAFLDSDDTWIKEKLAIQVQAMQAHPQIDGLFSNFTNIDPTAGVEIDTFKDYAGVIRLLKLQKLDDSLFLITAGFPENLALENYIATDTVIMRRFAFDRVGGFNESLRNSEDFELWWRMGLEGLKFAYHNMSLLRRHKEADSLTRLSLINCHNRLDALDLCNKALHDKQMTGLYGCLDGQYRNVWQQMIMLNGSAGDKPEAIKAFLKSLCFGFRPGSLRLILQALFSERKSSQ